MKGATEFTSCTSSISGRGHVGQRHTPAVHDPQIDLLQIGVDAALGEQLLSGQRLVVGERDLRQRPPNEKCHAPPNGSGCARDPWFREAERQRLRDALNAALQAS